MSDSPVFTLTRHREIVAAQVQRAVERERQNVASVLEIQANTVGGVVGAALREVAEQVRAGASVTTPAIVGAAARREQANAENDVYDPPLSVPFDALTMPQRQRRLAKLAADTAEAHARLGDDLRADSERIAREAAERRAKIARGEDPDEGLYDELPEVRHTSDADDLARAAALSNVRPRK